MNFDVATISHIGNKRKTNQDRYLVQRQLDGSVLVAVADGMGGVPGGDKAATLAIETIEAEKTNLTIDAEVLQRTMMTAHKAVLEYALEFPEMDGMGTTLTVAAVRQDSVIWAHVGDSRLYMLRDGTLKQLSQDHRFLTSMVDAGDISPEEVKSHPLRNMLDQCLGCSSIEPDMGQTSIIHKDLLLLCSDGLYEDLTDEAMTTILNQPVTLEEKAGRLVSSALGSAGNDNITLVLVEINS